MPEVLRIETTNACNNSCIFCGNRKMTRKINFIDEQIVHKALIQAYGMKIRKVQFYTIGEPFLHAELPKFISMAKDIGFEYIFTNTNGGFLTKSLFKEVIEAGVSSIAFSINAINKKDYELIHGKDNFDGALDNLIWLNQYRHNGKHNFNLYVSFIKTKFTSYPENEIRKFFADKCDEVRIMNVQNIGGFLPEIDTLSVDNSDIFWHYEIPCRLLFKSVIVTCEGYLTACSVDFQNYLVYADLNTEDMNISWNNDVMKNLRKRHLSGDVKNLICDNCANNSIAQPLPLMHEYATEFNVARIVYPCETHERIDDWRSKNGNC